MRLNIRLKLMRHITLFAIALTLLLIPKPSFAQTTGRWEYYTHPARVNSLADDGDYFWASTWGGLIRFKKSDGSYRMYPEMYAKLYKSPNGMIWYTANGNTVSHFDGSRWITDTFRNDTNTISFYPPTTSIGIGVYCMDFDRLGQPVMLGDDSYHPYLLMRYDGTSWSKTLLPAYLRPLLGAGPISVKMDRNDDLWIIGGETNSGRYGNSTAVRIHDSAITVWKQEDGLPSSQNNSLYSIAMDSSGAVWVCRPTGAAKFDGSKWVSYHKPFIQSQPTNVVADRHNHLFFGGWYGVDEFDGTSWSHSAYPQVPREAHQLVTSTSGDLWLTSDSGVYRFANGQWSHYVIADGLPANYCNPAIADAQGEILIGTGEGVARFANGQWRTYAVPATITGNQVGSPGLGAALATDRDNNLFVTRIGDNGEYRPGVLEYDGSKWQTFTAKDGLVNDTVLDLACDPSGRMWFANQTGVSLHDQGTWSSFTMDDGKNRDRVYQCLAADSSGNLWVGCVHHNLQTNGWGIDSVPEILRVTPSQVNGLPPEWKTFGLTDIPHLFGFGPTNIATNKQGDIWATSYQDDSTQAIYLAVGGLHHFNGTIWETVNLDNGVANKTHIQTTGLACAPDGSVWISYKNGVKSNDGKPLGSIVHFNGRTWEHFGGNRDSLPGISESGALTIAPNGHLLACTNFGIVEYDGSNWSVKYSSGTGPIPGMPTAISVAPDGSTWVSTMNNGIAHFIPGAAGVHAHSSKGGIQCSVYPNPIVDNVYLNFSGSQEGMYQVTLSNIAGVRLKRMALSVPDLNVTTPLDFSGLGLASGAYFLTIEQEGDRVTLPVIKE
jgi:streptogramin lyase